MHNISIQSNKERADNVRRAQDRGTHVDNGWPHYSSHTGLCMCLDPCCQSKWGCKCKYCPCIVTNLDHSELLSILGNTILSTGEDGVRNGYQ
jgi:hypothetical protein